MLEGFLSCPRCEARFPVRRGVIDFGLPEAESALWRDAGGSDEDRGGPARAPGGPGGRQAGSPLESGPDDAVALAALLDLGEGGGFVLLGRGLAGTAARVAELAAGVELVVLADSPAEASARPRVTPVAGASGEALPLYDGRLRGAALLGGTAAALRESARAVRHGGRVVVLRPAPAVVEEAAGLALEVLAAEEAALVASRR